MRHEIKVGFSFGVTSGIITTLGLMIGLYSTTESRLVIIGGIFTIAIADAFSDALGIHIAEESENIHTHKQIWTATIATFFFKFLFAITFIIPVLLFELKNAVIFAVIWGLSILSFLSYKIAASQHAKPWKIISEHLFIAFIVIICSHYAGEFVSVYFKG